METFTLYIDGASKGNPGKSAIGVVICKNSTTIFEKGEYIGISTNNIAEYMALIYGLIKCLNLGAKKVLVKSDSLLLVRQIKGEYKVKNNFLEKLKFIADLLIKNFVEFEIIHIPRKENEKADRIASQVISNSSLFG